MEDIIKKISKEMLRQWPRGRWNIEHAFFKKDSFSVDGKDKTITSNRDAYEAAIDYWEKEIYKAKDESALLSLVNKGYKEEWLRKCRPYIEDDIYSRLLCEADVKAPDLLRGADKKILMTKREYSAYRKLPNNVTLYGDGDSDSWNRDKEYINRCREWGWEAFKAKVSKNDILRCCFDSNGKLLCIVQPRKKEKLLDRKPLDQELSERIRALACEYYEGDEPFTLYTGGELHKAGAFNSDIEWVDLPFSSDEIELEEPFNEFLFELLNEHHVDNETHVYKKAGFTRSQWSNYKNGKSVPNKVNALALAIAMELDLEETEELLRRSGKIFDLNNPWDSFVKACIKEKDRFSNGYDLFEINRLIDANKLTPVFDIRNVV